MSYPSECLYIFRAIENNDLLTVGLWHRRYAKENMLHAYCAITDETAVSCAIVANNVEALCLLLGDEQMDIDPFRRDKYIQKALNSSCGEIFEILVKAGLDVLSSPAIIASVCSGDVTKLESKIKNLIKVGLDINTLYCLNKGECKTTLLHVATSDKLFAVTDALLRHGADPQVPDEAGKTVYELLDEDPLFVQNNIFTSLHRKIDPIAQKPLQDLPVATSLHLLFVDSWYDPLDKVKLNNLLVLCYDIVKDGDLIQEKHIAVNMTMFFYSVHRKPQGPMHNKLFMEVLLNTPDGYSSEDRWYEKYLLDQVDDILHLNIIKDLQAIL